MKERECERAVGRRARSNKKTPPRRTGGALKVTQVGSDCAYRCAVRLMASAFWAEA